MQKFQLNVWAATLGASAGVAYLVCVIFQPIFPAWAMYTADHWPAMFPGFSWTLVGVLIGLVGKRDLRNFSRSDLRAIL